MENRKCPHCGYEHETEYQKQPNGGFKEVAIKGDEPIKEIHLTNDVKMFMWRDDICDEHKKVSIFGCPKCKFVYWSETF